MKSIFRILPKHTAMLASMIVLVVAAFVLQTNFVHGTPSLRPHSTPVVKANVTMYSNRGNPRQAKPVVATATTDANGNFTLTGPAGGAFLPGGYTFGITPASVPMKNGTLATPLPFQVSIAFTSPSGLLINGNRVGTYSTMTNQTFTLGFTSTTVSTITGTLTK